LAKKDEDLCNVHKSARKGRARAAQKKKVPAGTLINNDNILLRKPEGDCITKGIIYGLAIFEFNYSKVVSDTAFIVSFVSNAPSIEKIFP